MEYKIGCVIMASGFSSRFEENKLYKELDGITLIDRALQCIDKENFHKIVVVSQYDEIKDKSEKLGFHFIKNKHPQYGISNTIKLGLDYTKDCDATMFMVSDQPLLRKESVSKMLDYYKEHSDNIISLGYNGKRGNPCIFPKAYYNELLDLTGDNGGSVVIKLHEDKLKIFNATHSYEISDIDTKEDLLRLEKAEVKNGYT